MTVEPAAPSVPCPYCTRPVDCPWKDDGDVTDRVRCTSCGRLLAVQWTDTRVVVRVVRR